jgi:hypothetical protein
LGVHGGRGELDRNSRICRFVFEGWRAVERPGGAIE